MTDNEATKTQKSTCPHCGYCPTCGRSAQGYPWYPQPNDWPRKQYPFDLIVYSGNCQEVANL